MAFNEREVYYQSQINEYQIMRDQVLLQMKDLQSELLQIQEEKRTIESQLNETINTLQQDHENFQNELSIFLFVYF